MFIKFLNPVFKRITGSKVNTEHMAAIGSIINSLEALDQDSASLKLELVITSSSGLWLDSWGEWFGVSRLKGEADEEYRSRIVSLFSNPHITIPALITAVRSYFNDPNADVKIYEPYNNIKKFNISEFSGEDVFQSGTYYRSSVIDISIADYIIDSSLRDSINQIKSAGIKVYFSNHISLNDNNIWVPITPTSDPLFNRTVTISLKVNNGDILIRSGYYRPGENLRSGKQEIFTFFSRETNIPLVEDTSKVYDASNEISSLLYPSRSGLAFRSGWANLKEYRGGFSGYKLSEYDTLNPLPWNDETNVIIQASEFVSRDGEQTVLSECTTTTEIQETAIVSPDEETLFASYETNLRGSLAKTILAGSFDIINDVGDITIENADTFTSYSQPDFGRTVETITA